MSLAYESEHGQVFFADARDVLPALATESVGLVVTDPPYGKEWISGRRAESFGMLDGDTADDRTGIRDVLRESIRVVDQHRHLYVFGPTDILEGLKVTAPVQLVWDKGTVGSGDLTSPWAPAHEPISFVVSLHRHAGKAGSSSLAARLRKGSVLQVNRLTGKAVRRHPTEKPVGLLTELIESSSKAGEIVLDPFAGSGSTAVAALLRGRRYIVIERDDRYIKGIVDRIREAEDAVARHRYL